MVHRVQQFSNGAENHRCHWKLIKVFARVINNHPTLLKLRNMLYATGSLRYQQQQHALHGILDTQCPSYSSRCSSRSCAAINWTGTEIKFPRPPSTTVMSENETKANSNSHSSGCIVDVFVYGKSSQKVGKFCVKVFDERKAGDLFIIHSKINLQQEWINREASDELDSWTIWLLLNSIFIIGGDWVLLKWPLTFVSRQYINDIIDNGNELFPLTFCDREGERKEKIHRTPQKYSQSCR